MHHHHSAFLCISDAFYYSVVIIPFDAQVSTSLTCRSFFIFFYLKVSLLILLPLPASVEVTSVYHHAWVVHSLLLWPFTGPLPTSPDNVSMPGFCAMAMEKSFSTENQT